MTRFYRAVGNGIDIVVGVTPRGGADALEGVEETADGRAYLKARVRAAPEKGAANTALEKLLAKALALPRSQVAVTGGAASRLKTLRIAGDGGEIARKLDELRKSR